MRVISAEPEVLGPSQEEMINSTECEEDTAPSPYSELIVSPKRNVKNIINHFINTTLFYTKAKISNEIIIISFLQS